MCLFLCLRCLFLVPVPVAPVVPVPVPVAPVVPVPVVPVPVPVSVSVSVFFIFIVAHATMEIDDYDPLRGGGVRRSDVRKGRGMAHDRFGLLLVFCCLT